MLDFLKVNVGKENDKESVSSVAGKKWKVQISSIYLIHDSINILVIK
jgi:hypothetical protein